MSLDGYIAKPNDDLTFLKLVEKAGEDYGYGEFTDTIDNEISLYASESKKISSHK